LQEIVCMIILVYTLQREARKRVHIEETMGIGIREAREALPSLIKRAALAGEDIQVGARGVDEVTLVATGKYRRLNDELTKLRSEVVALRTQVAGRPKGEMSALSEPFSGLQRALEAGLLDTTLSEPRRARRVIPGYSAFGSHGREDRIQIGSRGSVQPERRRRSPRA
jgi:antitoxin (DNA-binding transcriptional repressor) of toxin-antitoxin stability system